MLAAMIIIPLFFLISGYFLWKNALEKYEHNIFSFWVIIRLAISLLIAFLNPYIGIVVFLFFSLWNFFVTLKNTSLITAIVAVIYQPIALFFAISVINKTIRSLNDE